MLDPDGDPFRTGDGSCSALVQAALTEHDAFPFDSSDPNPDPDDIHVHVEDMYPRSSVTI